VKATHSCIVFGIVMKVASWISASMSAIAVKPSRVVSRVLWVAIGILLSKPVLRAQVVEEMLKRESAVNIKLNKTVSSTIHHVSGFWVLHRGICV